MPIRQTLRQRGLRSHQSHLLQRHVLRFEPELRQGRVHRAAMSARHGAVPILAGDVLPTEHDLLSGDQTVLHVRPDVLR